MPFGPGSRHTPEAIAKIAAASAARVRTPEWGAKISAAASRRKLDPETREKIAAANRGRPKSPETRQRLSDAQRGRSVLTRPVLGECVYCGGEAREWDHVIPRGRPGWDDPGNLVLACVGCNRAKGPRTPEEWFAQVG